MKHEVPHDLDMATAKKAVDRAFATYKQRFAEYSPTMSWATDQKAEVGFGVKGITLKGTIEVLPRTIGMDLDVPFIFRIFRSKALEVIEAEIRVWIEKAKAGQI